jgi:quercetin dioxygenase-like cupin family protein
MANKTSVRVMDMARSIRIQKGTVVSREILRKKTGTVTLFGFDKGQGLSAHSAPYDALVVLVDGEAELTVAGRKFRVKKGESIILPAGKPHALLAVKPFKMLLVMIK